MIPNSSMKMTLKGITALLPRLVASVLVLIIALFSSSHFHPAFHGDSHGAQKHEGTLRAAASEGCALCELQNTTRGFVAPALVSTFIVPVIAQGFASNPAKIFVSRVQRSVLARAPPAVLI